MSLPVLKTPTYFMTIPSTKKKVKYRPFLVQEEKILMMIKEGNDELEIINAMKELISVCTFNKLNVSELALFDIEYMFLQLRSKSVGEKEEIPMKCKNIIPSVEEDDDSEGTECGNIIRFEVDLSKIKVKTPKDHTRNVIIEDDIGIIFKYPNIDSITNIDDIESNPIEYIVSLIESIFDNDGVYDASTVNKKELIDWINKLTRKQFEQIQHQFFESMPTLEHNIKYTCDKCGYEGIVNFNSVSDFF